MKFTALKAIKGVIISLIIIIATTIPKDSQAQKSEKSPRASGPVLSWAFTHPFIAIKAKKLTKRALFVTDSLEAAGVFKDRSGGQLDAFKHAYWMALLAQNIKLEKAQKLGEAHEKFNMKTKNDNTPDSIASEMDRWNNDIGLLLGLEYHESIDIQLIDEVINAIQNGDMKVINKDEDGNYLDCDNQLIDKIHLKTWIYLKCLKPSDYQYN